jgi:hypothetical protein
MKLRNISLAIVLSVIACTVAAQAPAPAPAASGAPAGCVKEKLSTESLVAELLDNPAAKAVLIKHVPTLKDNDQFEMARPMSLRAVQAYAEDTFTDKILDAIDADLSKLPVCGK